MDLPQAIDIQKTAIARIAAGLFALLGLTAGAALGRISREIHRTVLHVLRPAESAVRRLIVVLARAIDVKAPSPQPAPAGIFRAGQGKPRIAFQLFDPRQRIFMPPRRPAPGPGPRIAFFGDGGVRRISLGCEPPPPGEDKADSHVDSANIVRRLEALKAALGDLPGQARRLARALARRGKSPRLKFKGPLRPGYAPGYRRRPLHEIDRVLHECDWLARELLPPDTS